MNGTREKTPDCSERPLAACSARFSALTGLRGAIASVRQALIGPTCLARAKLFRQRRLVDISEGAGCSRMVKPGKSSRGRSRTSRSRLVGNHTPGIAHRMPAFRRQPLPLGLRPIEARRRARVLHAFRAHARRSKARNPAERIRSGPLATRQKIKMSGPATERSNRISFRHGTRVRSHGTEKGGLRSATEQNPLFLGVAAFRHGSPLYITISRPCFSAGEVPTCS